MLEMTIDSIRVSPMNYQRIVILKQKDGDKFLPIWIGPQEADAIAVKLQDMSVPRPLTHDLLCSFLDIASASVEHVLINNLESDTFYARILFKIGDKVEFGNCYSPVRQCFKRWGIDNSFYAIRGWDKMFPGLVKLPESLLVDWDPNNAELAPLVTTTSVPGGPLIMPERWSFEEKIGNEMLYDEQNDQFIFKTNLYEIVFTESSGNPPGSAEKQLRWQFFGCSETDWCLR